MKIANADDEKILENINCKISVVMPTYNAEKYLKEAIDSILNQTFQDFELLVIDDNSTDNTIEILNSYKDERIKIIQGHGNGLSAARNLGFEKSRGEYLAIMDADDISHPKRLEKQVREMDSDDNLDLCGSFCLQNKENSTPIEIRYPITNEDIKTSLFFFDPIAQPSVMIRKSTFEKYNLKYRENFDIAEDLELWTRCAESINFYNINEPLIAYRVHSENSSSINSTKMSDIARQLHKSYIKKMLGVDIDDDIISAFRPPERLKNVYSVAQIQKIVEVSKLLINNMDKTAGEYNKALFNKIIMDGIDEIMAKMQDNIDKGLLVE